MATTSLPKSSQLDWTGDALLLKDVVATGSVFVNGSTISSTTVDTVNNLTASATEINRNNKVSTRMVAGGSTLTVTEALHDGKIIALDTLAGTTATLPASTGGGATFKFMVTVLATSLSHIIKVANATDVMTGSIWISDTDTAGTTTAFSTAASSDTITLNRSTTGSVTKGEYIELVDYAAGFWAVRGFLSNTGNGATPFSATV